MILWWYEVHLMSQNGGIETTSRKASHIIHHGSCQYPYVGAIFEVKIHFPPGLVNRHKTINTSNESLETRLDNQLGQVHPFNTYQSAIKLFWIVLKDYHPEDKGWLINLAFWFLLQEAKLMQLWQSLITQEAY